MRRLFFLFLALTFLCGALACLAACGKKGDPEPRSREPLRGNPSLTLQRSPEGIVLTWPIRASAERGVFRIERRDIPTGEGACGRCVDEAALIGEIAPTDRRFCSDGALCVMTDRKVRRGGRYAYKVRWCRAAGECEDYTAELQKDY